MYNMHALQRWFIHKRNDHETSEFETKTRDPVVQKSLESRDRDVRDRLTLKSYTRATNKTLYYVDEVFVVYVTAQNEQKGWLSPTKRASVSAISL